MIDLDELERLHEAARAGWNRRDGMTRLEARIEALEAAQANEKREREAACAEALLMAESNRGLIEALEDRLADAEESAADLRAGLAELEAIRSAHRERLIRDACGAWDGGSPIADAMNRLTRHERERRAKEKP